jgi:hypothetical protein
VYASMKKEQVIPRRVRDTCLKRRADIEANEERSHEWNLER